jgi:hypothetical protein
MGQSVDAKIAYGFAVNSEGTPESLEDYGPYGSDEISPLLDVSYYGWSDFMAPVVHVKSSKVWAMDGSPKAFTTIEITPEEQAALEEAREHVIGLMKEAGEYDEGKWGPNVEEIGWLVWGSYG